MHVQEALAELTSLGITWKKQRDRGKKIFYVYLDRRKIGRATTEAGVPLVVQKHLKELSAGDHAPPLFRLHCILMMDVCMDALTIMSCVSTLTISCMCKLAHATCVIICDAVDEASGLGEAVEDGEAAGGSSHKTRRDPLSDPVLQTNHEASHVGQSRHRFAGSYDDVVRRKVGRCSKAGPGRGKRKAGVDSDVRANNAYLMSSQQALLECSVTVQEIRSALGREVKAHQAERARHAGTKRKLAHVTGRLHSSTALLMKEHQYGDDEGADKRRRVAIADACGQGWSSLDGSYFRKKKAVAMAFVRDLAGDPDLEPSPDLHPNPNRRR